MKDLQTKAAQYAAEKANELISGAIAQAYIDGYRDGFRDKENETPVNLADSDNKYVDLGLPSGTLWAADYERTDDGELLYVSYVEAKAKGYKLPTEEQVRELCNCCRQEYNLDTEKIEFLGPNGNWLTFEVSGKLVASDLADTDDGFIWQEQYNAKSDSGTEIETNAFRFYRTPSWGDRIGVITSSICLFTGYKIPVRQVR